MKNRAAVIRLFALGITTGVGLGLALFWLYLRF
jgi:hypothetical protein